MRAREVIADYLDSPIGRGETAASDYMAADGLVECLASAGYAIVPIQPSERMIEAGVHAPTHGSTFEMNAKATYSAMLRAANE